MCRSVESGATGYSLKQEGYLYLDDTIKNAEQIAKIDCKSNIFHYINIYG